MTLRSAPITRLVVAWVALCAALPAACATAPPSATSPSVPTAAIVVPTVTPAVAPTATATGLSLTIIAPEVLPTVRRDVTAALEAAAPGICAALVVACDFPVTVELYPDQAALDRHVMNPDMRGFFAVSGGGRIQMVSPANVASRDLTYEDATGIAAHEFVHLALDRIAPELPDWLEEGTAVYLGPHAVYEAARGEASLRAMTPTFAALRDDYGNVPAADFFAYTVVAYIVETRGIGALNALLRAPDDLEAALGMTEAAFAAGWRVSLEE